MRKRICTKSLLALLLTLVLLGGILPIAAFSASGEDTHTVWIDSGPTRHKLTVNDGATIDPPSIPRRDGYAFLGWYEDGKYGERWNFNVDRVYKSMSLQAKWTARDEDDDEYYRDYYSYYGNPYYTSNGYYSDSYRDFYYSDYYNDYFYSGYYRDGEFHNNPYWNSRTEKVEVEGAEEQVYTGKEDIVFTIYGKSRPSLLAIVVFPRGNRNQEVVLEKGDFFLHSPTDQSGLDVILSQDYLKTLKSGRYEVRVFFAAGQGNAEFEVA